MKAFKYHTYEHEKLSSKGKGFPRHLYKKISTNEDEQPVQERYKSSGKVGMNRSYGNLLESGSGHNHTFPRYNHIIRWLGHRIGQNADKVYSEFREAWNLQPALKSSCSNVRDWFDQYIYREGHSKCCDFWDRKNCPFLIDSQNRIQKNPDYSPHRHTKKKLFDDTFVRDNRPILDKIQAKFDKEYSALYWTSGGDGVGPIGVTEKLWIIHPKTNLPVKASVSLIRSAALKCHTLTSKLSNNLSCIREAGLKQKLSAEKIEWLNEGFVPVNVIWDNYSSHRQLQVKCSPTGLSTYLREWTFVVSKSHINNN